MSIPLPANFKGSNAEKVLADLAKGWTLSTDLSVDGSGSISNGKKSKPVSQRIMNNLRKHGFIEAVNLAWPVRTFRLTGTGKALARNGGRA